MKAFHVVGSEDVPFTMKEEEENGDLSLREMNALDSIAVGECFTVDNGTVYKREPDVPFERFDEDDSEPA
jgi:hypothetical protein